MTERLAPLPYWLGVRFNLALWDCPQSPVSTTGGYAAVGNGGVNSIPPQHSIIIAMRDFIFRKP